MTLPQCYGDTHPQSRLLTERGCLRVHTGAVIRVVRSNDVSIGRRRRRQRHRRVTSVTLVTTRRRRANAHRHRARAPRRARRVVMAHPTNSNGITGRLKKKQNCWAVRKSFFAALVLDEFDQLLRFAVSTRFVIRTRIRSANATSVLCDSSPPPKKKIKLSCSEDVFAFLKHFPACINA